MEQFKINYYFNLYKDRAITSARIFRSYMKVKHNITDIRLSSEIYSKINKYQVKKYGTNITNGCNFSKELAGAMNNKAIAIIGLSVGLNIMLFLSTITFMTISKDLTKKVEILEQEIIDYKWQLEQVPYICECGEHE